MRVIAAVDPVDVFVNERGWISIKQEDRLGNEDSIVGIPPSQIALLCRALRQAEKQAKDLLREDLSD